MDTFLQILGWSAFGLAIVVGLGLDLVGLFGNWIILAAMAAAWALSGFEHFGPWTLVGVAVVAALGEVLETAFAGYGAKKFGGSKGSVVAALIGCLVGAVVGTPWFPILGTLLGACLGAFLSAATYDYIKHEKQAYDAALVGIGAALGKVAGLFAKLFCGFIILIIAFLFR